MLATTLPFQIDGSAVFFMKSGAPEGRKRRIAGVISTETRDRQQEIIVQKGLDFESFLTYGWFNDNHSKATDGVVGYPERIEQFRKGQTLPNGTIAKSNCTWAEGYLLDGSKRADAIWELGQALAKSGGSRGLGFSIEGVVQKRMGPGRRIVAKAMVQNVAVTNMPVNPDTKMEILAKSLLALPFMDDPVAKALGMGAADGSSIADAGPQTGVGAGQVLTPESLEQDKRDLSFQKKKKLKKSEAIAFLRKRLPALRDEQIARVVDAAIMLGRQP
jgi:hypothetical protein